MVSTLDYIEHLIVFLVAFVVQFTMIKQVPILSDRIGYLTQDTRFGVFFESDLSNVFDLIVVLDQGFILIMRFLLIIFLYRVIKETSFLERIWKSITWKSDQYRKPLLDIKPAEFSAVLDGMLKSSNGINLEELAELTGQREAFWKKIIYSLISSNKVRGTISGSSFTLAKGQNRDNFIDTLVSSVFHKRGENVQSSHLPDFVKERRCCQMNGRNGDTYCNVCGRVIPDEFQVSSIN